MPMRHQHQLREREAGASYLELLVAISIVGIALMVMLQQLSISHREASQNHDRVFAYQKGLAMLNELQAAVERGVIKTAHQLEMTADLTDCFVLTTLRDEQGAPLPPDHPSSGNRKRAGAWLWSRRIQVGPQVGNPRLRRVQVVVRSLDEHGVTRHDVASIATILNLPDESGPTTQDYDVYALALSAVPSTYMALPSLRSTFEAAIDEIAQRCPGLRFRVHWITELGYGRDTGYVPYFNTAQGATAAAPYAYWYPSRCDQVMPALFAPENFGARVRTDAGILHDLDLVANPLPYAVADQFNHATRLPEARKLFEMRVVAGLNKRDEPPLQILLQDMCDEPSRFRNAIFIDLHGEILPFPPLRNYADAARSPTAMPGVRVVTHPARLRADRDPDADGDPSDSRPIELRVHAYKDLPTVGPVRLDVPITLRLFGVDLSANVNGVDPTQPTTLEVRRLQGGLDVDTGAIDPGADYAGFDTPTGLPPRPSTRLHPHEMAFECGFVATPTPYTWIRLHDTPLVAPSVGGRGLDSTGRLYGMDYVPSPVARSSGGEDFPVDLATDGSGPKNTARWRIRIPAAALGSGFPGGGLPNKDQMLAFDTRIGTDVDTGRMWPVAHDPCNLSTTYAWWAHAPEAVPLTERYQILGDPRHNPYADLVEGGNSFPGGYDCCFDDLRDGAVDATTAWPCLDATRLQDGFGAGVFFDVPRAMQVWRTALLRSAVVFASFGGRFAGSISLGADICLPADVGEVDPGVVPLHGASYGITGYAAVDTLGIEDLGSPAAPGPPATVPKIGAVLVQDSTGAFTARPWLGELWPDASAGTWMSQANLSTNPMSGGFHRVPRQQCVVGQVPAGTTLELPGGGRLGALGAATLFQCGSASTSFAQRLEPNGTTAAPVDSLRDLFLAVGIGLGENESIRFTSGLAEVLPTTLPHRAFAADYPEHFCQELERLARGPDQRSASSVLRLTAPDGHDRAYFALDGISASASLSQDHLVRSTLLFGLHSLWVAAHPAFDNDIAPDPRLLITSPEQGAKFDNPAAIPLRWRTTFERFDGAHYTISYPELVNGDEANLRYRVFYSLDNGVTWRDPETGQVVDPTQRLSAEAMIQDAGFGDENLLLEVPAELVPAGNCMFRVVVHNALRDAHIAWHDVFVQITRPEGSGGKLGK